MTVIGEFASDQDDEIDNPCLYVSGLTRKSLSGEGVFGEATAPAGQYARFYEARNAYNKPTGAERVVRLYPSLVNVRMTPKQADELIEPISDNDPRQFSKGDVYPIDLIALILRLDNAQDQAQKMVVIEERLAMSLFVSLRQVYGEEKFGSALKHIQDTILHAEDMKARFSFAFFNEIIATVGIIGRLPESN